MGFVINKNRKNTDVLSVFFCVVLGAKKWAGWYAFLRYEKRRIMYIMYSLLYKHIHNMRCYVAYCINIYII